MKNRKSLIRTILIGIVAYFLISSLLSSFKKDNNQNTISSNTSSTYESNDVTVMVYMIGTDLESQYGMATKDIYEMLYGKEYDNINVVLQTGGCRKWNNSLFSSSTVERWAINSQNFSRLKDAGRVSMTDPDTLIDFISYTADNFPAERNILILWDHGGGSETGFGYDENYPNSGSLSPDLLAKALSNAGVKFDFIGFDACLMANLETAIAIEPYADYLVASEETEPGEGWYYTNWIKMLDENPNTSTLDLTKTIIDDYVSYSVKTDYRAEVTQSVIDLHELVNNIKEPLKKFSKATSDKLNGSNYQSVANARSNTKEFSKESYLDQVDLVDLAENINVNGSSELIDAVKSAVKYNKTQNISSSNGLSIYFPYSSLSMVNSMIEIYDGINMDENYTNVVKSFATYASSGQIVTQNSGSSSTSLFDVLLDDDYYTNDYYYSHDNYYDYFSGSQGSYGYEDIYGSGYDSWMSDMAIDLMSSFFRSNRVVKPSSLSVINKNNQRVVSLSDDEWNLIDSVTLNMFIDDGKGYLDLGKDNSFELNNDGDLIVSADGTWLTINGHVVSYKFVSEEYIDDNNYKILGYIPAYLNNQRVNLIINFTNDNPDGIVLGAQSIYDNSNIQAKGLIPINDGDEIKFICNYYAYDGTFIDEYQINDTLIVDGTLDIYNVYLDNNYVYAYCFKDYYGNNMWTEKTVVNN